MKKFGTPTAGAPGSDTESVGLRALGTPRPVGMVDACEVTVVVVVVVFVPVVDWGWACRAPSDAAFVARRVAVSGRDVPGRAADVGVDFVRLRPAGVDPGTVGLLTVRVVAAGVDRVEVVDVRVVPVIDVPVVVPANGAAAVDGALTVVVSEPVADPASGVEIEVVAAGTEAEEAVVGMLVVVELGVEVAALVTVAVVLVIDAVVVAAPAAHEFDSVMLLVSNGPAAGPS